MTTDRPPRATDDGVPTRGDETPAIVPLRIVTTVDEAGIPSLELRGGEIEQRYSVPDPYLRLLFMALCKQLGLMAYRRARQRAETICVRASIAQHDRELWPRYLELSNALEDRLVEISEQFIRDRLPGALPPR